MRSATITDATSLITVRRLARSPALPWMRAALASDERSLCAWMTVCGSGSLSTVATVAALQM